MIQNLAHVSFRSPAADQWRPFATDILGAALGPDGPDAAVRVRIDDRPWRIEVRPGERDELAALGWDIAAENLASAIAALEGLGIEVTDDAELAADRNAATAVRFDDPFGFRHELLVDIAEPAGFEPAPHLAGQFVTGAQGMGHIVLMVPDLDAADRFVTEGLGLVLSDTIHVGTTIRFYHCPGSEARHHTVAMSEVPGMVGVHHIMVEVTEPDDVGRAYDRVRDAGMTLAMDYGRHPNDLMTSFYVRTPSGFELEYGSGGVVIDDATWQVGSYDATSLWGHRPPADGSPRPGVLRRVESAAS